jgi:hypothetical protein
VGQLIQPGTYYLLLQSLEGKLLYFYWNKEPNGGESGPANTARNILVTFKVNRGHTNRILFAVSESLSKYFNCSSKLHQNKLLIFPTFCHISHILAKLTYFFNLGTPEVLR